MTTTSLPANPFAPDAQAGEVAVVTGASSGIGRATAELMAATGWTVYAVARRAERLEELASRTSVRPVVLDITDADAVAARAQEILGETGGRLDALVNISGGAIGADSVAQADPAGWSDDGHSYR